MESGFPDKQEVIWTAGYVFRIMQLTRDIPKNDKQYFLGITPWRSIGKLYGQLHYTGQDHEEIGRMNDQVPENCRKAQFVFQTIKIQF